MHLCVGGGEGGGGRGGGEGGCCWRGREEVVVGGWLAQEGKVEWVERGRRDGGGGISGAELQTVSPALALVREPLTITCSTRTDASASWRAHATLEQEPKRSETAAVQHQAPEDDLDQSTKKTRKTKKLKPNCVCVLNKPLEEPTEDL